MYCKCSFSTRVINGVIKETEPTIDHDHYSGQFIGIACKECNLQRQIQRVKIFMHNSSNYDNPLFFKSLTSELCEKISISSVIAKNSVKIRSFCLNNFFVINDSSEFLNGSLSTIASTLPKEHEYKILNQIPEINSFKRLGMCKKKLFYPYNFLDSLDKLNYEKIPEHKYFYNDLTGSNISESEYKSFSEMYKEFGFVNLKELTKFYCLIDVCLLAESFSNFRNKCYENFGLDVNGYISLPAFSYNAFLKNTGVELETIQNEEMHSFARNNLRGGFSFVSTRWAEGSDHPSKLNEEKSFTTSKNCENIKDFSFIENENENEIPSYILNLDCNSLYPSSMLYKLPMHGYEWLNDKEIKKMYFELRNNPEKLDENGDIGYILEADFEYPLNLHNAHSDLPYLIEKKLVSEEMISPYQKNLITNLENKNCLKTEKLISHLGNRKNYIANLRIIKQALLAGLKITNLKRGIKFTQSHFLGDYIRKLLDMRAEAETKFEKDVIKLVCNALFGKFLFDPTKLKTCRIVTNENLLNKYMSSTYLHDFHIFNEKLAFIFMDKNEIEIDQPMFIGTSILDNSKYAFFEIYYKILRKEFGPSTELCISDTDSFFIKVKSRDIDQSFKNILPILDTSNLPKNHDLFSEINKNSPFYLKDESKGVFIKFLCAPAVKSYAIQYYGEGKDDKITCKGTPKYTFNKTLNYKNFENTLFNKQKTIIYSKRIVTDRKTRDVNTISNYKVALSGLDTKRYILNCGIHTYAFFHNNISKHYAYCFKCKI